MFEAIINLRGSKRAAKHQCGSNNGCASMKNPCHRVIDVSVFEETLNT